MNREACHIIDGLGGNAEVARLTKAPATTVHGWRRVGLSASRLDHLRLAAIEAGLGERFASLIAVHSEADTTEAAQAAPGKSAEISGQTEAA